MGSQPPIALVTCQAEPLRILQESSIANTNALRDASHHASDLVAAADPINAAPWRGFFLDDRLPHALEILNGGRVD